MAINPQHQGAFTYQDYSKESSTMSFNFGPITALTIAGFLTQFGALRTATNNIVLGTLKSDRWTGDITKYSADPPADPDAQRERKYLVRFQDTTTLTLGRLEIPTADLLADDRMIPNTDFINLTETDIAAWITAFEAIAKSDTGNPVSVIDIQAVGRNL